MFKKVLTVCIVLLLAFTVSGARLVDPISKDVSSNDFVGAIVPGSTLELIFSKELGKYDSLEVLNSLPSGFEIKVSDYLEAIKVYVISQPNVATGSYSLDIKLLGENKDENVDVYFNVEKDLLDVSLNNYSSETTVNDKAVYEFYLINNSDADVVFTIQPLIPKYWLAKNESPCEDCVSTKTNIIATKQKVTKFVLEVYPKISGERTFDTMIFLGNNDSKKQFTLNIKTNPTFGGKLKSVFYGVPFYSISMLPSYYLTGFFGLLFN